MKYTTGFVVLLAAATPLVSAAPTTSNSDSSVALKERVLPPTEVIARGESGPEEEIDFDDLAPIIEPEDISSLLASEHPVLGKRQNLWQKHIATYGFPNIPTDVSGTIYQCSPCRAEDRLRLCALYILPVRFHC